MNIFKKINPEWMLRSGLGFMFLYSGFDIFMHPTGWYWAIRPLPQFIQNIITSTVGIDMFLKIQALGELTTAFLLLAWFLPNMFLKIGAVISTIEMAAILLLVGLDAVTFRDIGLLGAGLALCVIAFQKQSNGI